MTRTSRHWACVLALSAAALALPASASAAGTWTSPDFTNLTVSWRTDDGKSAFRTAFRLTQPVSAAESVEGGPCRLGVNQDPAQVECPVSATGVPASSGTITFTVRTPVGCADGFEHRVSLDGQTLVDQQAITSGNSCAPPPPPPPPPPESDEEPAGAPVSAPLLPLVVGADAGAGPQVKTFSPADLGLIHSFFAYGPSFSGGVRVAVGDVNGDGRADLATGTGAGAPPHVKVFDGVTGALLRSFLAYDAGFTGGIYVAAGDVNRDGRADIVTGAGTGAGPHVKVIDGASGGVLKSFFAHDPAFLGGVRVAAGDVSGDGRADIVTATGAGAPQIRVFDGATGVLLRSFLAYGPVFTGGVFVAAGDVNGDGRADVITGAGSTSSHVKVFDGATGALLRSFFAHDPSFAGGVRVAAGEVDGDGFADILTGPGPGGSPQVRVFSGATGAVLRSFFAFGPSFAGGVFVGATTFPGARLRSGTVRLTAAGDALLSAVCPPRILGICRGRVTLLLSRARKTPLSSSQRTKRRIVLGTARFRARPAKRARIRIHVSTAGRRAIDRRSSSDALVRLTTRDGGSNVNTKLMAVVLKARDRR